MAEWMASPNWDREAERSWVRIPVSLGVTGSDGICKYLSCLSLTLCYCMRAFFVSVCVNLRHCGHLALSCSLKLRAKLVFCLVDLKACVPKLCVLLYSAVMSCLAACLVCHCNRLRWST